MSPKLVKKYAKFFKPDWEDNQALEKDPGQQIQQLARDLKVNRTFLAGYLLALENVGYVKSKKIGPAKCISTRRTAKR